MAYEKKDNYPSYAKPGVYPSGSIKELGLDNSNLERFSLGNWNSIFRGNKLFLSGDLLNEISKNEDAEIPVKVNA